MMRFAKDKAYKLIEFHGGLLITEHDREVKNDPTVKALILATAGDLLTYLDRYFYEREKGGNMLDSHNAALQTVGVTHTLPQKKPS